MATGRFRTKGGGGRVRWATVGRWVQRESLCLAFPCKPGSRARRRPLCFGSFFSVGALTFGAPLTSYCVANCRFLCLPSHLPLSPPPPPPPPPPPLLFSSHRSLHLPHHRTSTSNCFARLSIVCWCEAVDGRPVLASPIPKQLVLTLLGSACPASANSSKTADAFILDPRTPRFQKEGARGQHILFHDRSTKPSQVPLDNAHPGFLNPPEITFFRNRDLVKAPRDKQGSIYLA
jgi:hypothetical protein